MTDTSGISRRMVLTVAANAAGALTGVAALVGGSTSAQAAKAPQKAVKYQDMPKGEQRCDNCALFEPPSSCKTVDGTISPEGWCMIYAKKSA
jgi:high potential iron-sulfur protein